MLGARSGLFTGLWAEVTAVFAAGVARARIRRLQQEYETP